jgi:hypothetical protein
VIKGATLLAAVIPHIESTANRRPSFLVFHTRTSFNGSWIAALATVLADASSWTDGVVGPVDIVDRRSLISSAFHFPAIPIVLFPIAERIRMDW